MDTRARGQTRPTVRLSALPPRLFLVTSDEVVADVDFVVRAREAIKAGRERIALQLRARELAGRRFLELARRLRAEAAETGTRFWVNDRIDVALAVRADGLQLGSASLPLQDARQLLGASCLFGCSVHGGAEAEAFADQGADLLVLGNIYRTTSHPGRPGIGVETVGAAAETGRPIIAIGGITPEKVREVVGAGAWGVAVLGGVWRAEDVARAVRLYLERLSGPSTRGGS